MTGHRTFQTRSKTEASDMRPQADLLKTTSDVGEALKLAWPETSVGQIRKWSLDRADSKHPGLEIIHLGTPLGATAEALLSSLLSERFHAALVVRDIAVPVEAVTANPEDGIGWLPALASAVEWVRGDRGLHACVTLPPAETPAAMLKRRHKPGTNLAPVRTAALAQLATAPQGQVHLAAGICWAVQLKTVACDDEKTTH